MAWTGTRFHPQDPARNCCCRAAKADAGPFGEPGSLARDIPTSTWRRLHVRWAALSGQRILLQYTVDTCVSAPTKTLPGLSLIHTCHLRQCKNMKTVNSLTIRESIAALHKEKGIVIKFFIPPVSLGSAA